MTIVNKQPAFRIGDKVTVRSGHDIPGYRNGWNVEANVFIGLTALIREEIPPESIDEEWAYILTFPYLSQQAMHSGFKFGLNKDGYVPVGLTWDERGIEAV